MSTDGYILHLARLLICYRTTVRLVHRSYAIYAVALGFAVLWGGDERMQGPSQRSAVMIAESVGSPPSVLWGTTVLLVGLIALASRRKVALCGLYGITAWSMLFAASATASLTIEPHAAVFAGFGHGFIALMTAGLIAIRVRDPRV